MRRQLRRALLGVAVAGLAIVLGATPAPAGVGTRLANGDGDTNGTCLSIENAGRSVNVLMERCTTNAHQGWEVWSGGNVMSQDADARGRCLTAHGEGNKVTMQPCLLNDNTQVWTVFHPTLGSDWFQLISYAHGTPQCLDVRDNGLSPIVQTWRCGPANKGNQLWKFF